MFCVLFSSALTSLRILLKVSGADDDSNFDIVEETPPVPDIASLKPNKEFKLTAEFYY